MSETVMSELICSQVFSRLFARLDRFDLEGVTKCFARNGVWHRQGAALDSHPVMLKALQARPAHLFVQHILHQVACEHVDETHIKAVAYMTVYRKDPPEKITPPLPTQVPDMVINWDVEFVLEEGAWLISRLGNVPLYR
ncbi:MAG: nuclear transport factor 2 family protein [Pseudomonadota bacterium]